MGSISCHIIQLIINSLGENTHTYTRVHTNVHTHVHTHIHTHVNTHIDIINKTKKGVGIDQSSLPQKELNKEQYSG